MQRQWRSRERRPGRREGSLAPRRRLLVVCEGKRTEPEYIRGFERHVRNATVQLKIPADRGDPRKLVEIAKRHQRTALALAKRDHDAFPGFDEVWCVFDRDDHDHDRFYQACNMAEANGFNLAISNPCIELWLLLHFRDSPGTQERWDLQRMMRDHLPGYDKGIDDFEPFQGRVADASRRARALDADALASDEAGRNPTTGFYRLTDAIARVDGR